MKKLTGNLLISAVILAAMTASVSCVKKEVRQGFFVSFYEGTVTIESQGSAARAPVIKELLKEGDLIKTGERSFLIIQTPDGLVIRVEADTETALSSINNSDSREITLNSGKLLSSVSKLKKGSEYIVKTRVAVASVRGTEFLTEYSGGRAVVAVGSGRVDVKRPASDAVESVDRGRAAVISGEAEEKIELREISELEVLEIERLRTAPVINNIESTDEAQIKKEFMGKEEQKKAIDEEIEKLLNKQAWTIEKIRAEYGRIDVITLYNGKTIRGAIVSRGAYVKVLTTGGVVSINAKDIRNTGMM
jgi:hypothetical protein